MPNSRLYLYICFIILFPLFQTNAIAINAQAEEPESSSEGKAPSVFETGRLEARKDIKNGILKLKTYGVFDISSLVYSKILRDEYGIILEIVAGRIATPDIVSITNGYNEIAIQEIERRFGTGILEEIWGRARGIYKGEWEANKDIENGKFKIKTFYPLVRWRTLYSRFLMNEYNVHLDMVSGTVNPELIGFVESYNQVSTKAIGKKYGTDALKGLQNRAQDTYLSVQKRQK